MDDDVFDPDDPANIEVGRRLDAYADLELTPSVAATTRMRTAVMNAAHRQAALIEADATIGAAQSAAEAHAARRARAARNAWRRPFAAVLAGCLTLGILAGAAYATKAGGPLYEVRIRIEKANLPPAPVDRAEAQVSRLEARLHEAQQASTDGDGPAAEAALSAYSTIVLEAAAGSRVDPFAASTIVIHVTRHVVVLTILVERVPAGARAALQQALSSCTTVLDDLGG